MLASDYISTEAVMGDKSPKNTAKTNKQKGQKRPASADSKKK